MKYIKRRIKKPTTIFAIYFKENLPLVLLGFPYPNYNYFFLYLSVYNSIYKSTGTKQNLGGASKN